MRVLFILLLCFFTSLSAFSQTSAADPVDVLGWYGTGVAFDLKNKWELGLDYQARFQNNLASLRGSYLSFSASKGIAKNLDLLAEYRLGIVKGSTFHRFSIGSELAPDIPKLDLSFRLLVLNNIQDFLDPAAASQNNLFWRARLKLGTRINKQWAWYVSCEPVMKFGGNRFVDNLRNTIGFKRRVSRAAKLDLYYMYRPDYAKASYNRLFHVIGVNLDFRAKLGKKK